MAEAGVMWALRTGWLSHPGPFVHVGFPSLHFGAGDALASSTLKHLGLAGVCGLVETVQICI